MKPESLPKQFMGYARETRSNGLPIYAGRLIYLTGEMNATGRIERCKL
jgi:hypothetical protein